MKEARPFISSLSSSCGGQRSRVLILKGRRQVHGEWSLHLGHQDAQPLVGGVGGASVLSVSSLLEASTETPSPSPSVSPGLALHIQRWVGSAPLHMFRSPLVILTRKHGI